MPRFIIMAHKKNTNLWCRIAIIYSFRLFFVTVHIFKEFLNNHTITVLKIATHRTLYFTFFFSNMWVDLNELGVTKPNGDFFYYLSDTFIWNYATLTSQLSPCYCCHFLFSINNKTSALHWIIIKLRFTKK